jgi:hypothetical protein
MRQRRRARIRVHGRSMSDDEQCSVSSESHTR